MYFGVHIVNFDESDKRVRRLELARCDRNALMIISRHRIPIQAVWLSHYWAESPIYIHRQTVLCVWGRVSNKEDALLVLHLSSNKRKSTSVVYFAVSLDLKSFVLTAMLYQSNLLKLRHSPGKPGHLTPCLSFPTGARGEFDHFFFIILLLT